MFLELKVLNRSKRTQYLTWTSIVIIPPNIVTAPKAGYLTPACGRACMRSRAVVYISYEEPIVWPSSRSLDEGDVRNVNFRHRRQSLRTTQRQPDFANLDCLNHEASKEQNETYQTLEWVMVFFVLVKVHVALYSDNTEKKDRDDTSNQNGAESVLHCGDWHSLLNLAVRNSGSTRFLGAGILAHLTAPTTRVGRKRGKQPVVDGR